MNYIYTNYISYQLIYTNYIYHPSPVPRVCPLVVPPPGGIGPGLLILQIWLLTITFVNGGVLAYKLHWWLAIAYPGSSIISLATLDLINVCLLGLLLEMCTCAVLQHGEREVRVCAPVSSRARSLRVLIACRQESKLSIHTRVQELAAGSRIDFKGWDVLFLFCLVRCGKVYVFSYLWRMSVAKASHRPEGFEICLLFPYTIGLRPYTISHVSWWTTLLLQTAPKQTLHDYILYIYMIY
jgi:hypothetical protein